MNLSITSLASWYHSPLGQSLAKLESEELRKNLPNPAGISILQLGLFEHTAWLTKNPTVRKIILNPYTPDQNIPRFAQSSYTQLPLTVDSIDLVLLNHTLETQPDAQSILAEAWRVLAPNGYVVVLGFNPWSLWELTRFLPHKEFTLPPLHHYYSAQKIRNWLFNLGGDVTVSKSFCYHIGVSNEQPLPKTNWHEKFFQFLLPTCGAIYLIIAQKLVMPLNPLRPQWQWEQTLAAKGMATPTAGRVRRE